MIDGVIAHTGNSRLVKANLPATYEEFKAQAAAAMLPIDLLFNAAGWSVQPTFLNKANLFSDETAAKYPSDTNTVDNALDYLDCVTSNIQTQINNLGVRVQQTAQLDIYKNGDIYEAYANSTLTITISPYSTSTDNFFGDGAYSGLNELGLTGIAASYLNSTQSTTLIGMAYAGEVDGQTDKLVLLQSELSTSVQRIRAVVAANSYSDYKVSIEPGTLVAKWIKT